MKEWLRKTSWKWFKKKKKKTRLNRLKCKTAHWNRDADAEEMKKSWRRITWCIPPSSSREISRDNNVTLWLGVLLQILNYKKRIGWLMRPMVGSPGAACGGALMGGEIQLFVYIHFPHSDYFINCPAFISSLPRLPLLIISSFIPHHKHTIAALWIQRICLLLTESRHSLMIGQRQTSKSAILFVSGWQPTKVLITFSQVIRRRRRVR